MDPTTWDPERQPAGPGNARIDAGGAAGQRRGWTASVEWDEPAVPESEYGHLVVVLGPAAIIGFDLLTAYLERFVSMPDAVTWAGTCAIYAAIGYLGARLGRPFAGAYTGLLVGLIDVFIGWRLQVLAGPPGWRPIYDELSQRDVLYAAITWGALGFGLAAAGAVVGWLVFRGRLARSGRAESPGEARPPYWEEI